MLSKVLSGLAILVLGVSAGPAFAQQAETVSPEFIQKLTRHLLGEKEDLSPLENLMRPSLGTGLEPEPFTDYLEGTFNHYKFQPGDDLLKMDGGWTGSGGGGGFIYFPTREKGVEFATATKAEKYRHVDNFTLYDIHDLDFPVDWKENENPVHFIRRRIQERIGHALPPVADYMLSLYDFTLRSPIVDTQEEELIHDWGSPRKQHPVGGWVAYVQWFKRKDDLRSPYPRFLLYRVKPLDDHLRKILTPLEYQRQFAVVMLHEALYAELALANLVQSGQVRRIIDYILMPDTKYGELVKNGKIDASVNNLISRGANALVTKALLTYLNHAPSKAEISPARLTQFMLLWNKLFATEVILGKMIVERQLGTYPEHKVANPEFAAFYGAYFYGWIYYYLSSTTRLNQTELLLNPPQAALLMALDAYARNPWPSFFDLFKDDENSRTLWRKNVCGYMVDKYSEWSGLPPADEAKSAREWINSTGLLYCEELMRASQFRRSQ